MAGGVRFSAVAYVQASPAAESKRALRAKSGGRQRHAAEAASASAARNLLARPAAAKMSNESMKRAAVRHCSCVRRVYGAKQVKVPASRTLVGGQRRESCAPWGQQRSAVWSQMRGQPKTRPEWRAKGRKDLRVAKATSPADDRH